MKTIIALARLYKGVLIFRSLDGYVIYNVIGERLIFASEQSAEDYVDDYRLANTFSAS